MQLQGFKKYLVALSLLGFCGSGWAIPYPIHPGLPSLLPLGVTLGEDIDGTGLFDPGNSLLTIEIFDFGERDRGAFLGTNFGFYYASDPLNLITIFYPSDNEFERATVDFGSGSVTDPEFPLPVTEFTPLGGSIGFYMFDPILLTTLYTEASRNVGEVDLSAAYPIFGSPLENSMVLGFAEAPPGPNGAFQPLYASAIGTPNPVPEPGTISLWLTGLAGLALFRRRLTSDSPVAATAAQ